MTGGTEDVAHPRLGTRRLATGRRTEPGAGTPPRVAPPPDPAAGPARPAGLAGLRPGGDGPCRVGAAGHARRSVHAVGGGAGRRARLAPALPDAPGAAHPGAGPRPGAGAAPC